MKTLKEVLEQNGPFQLSEYDKIVYNAQDHESHKTGVNEKGQKIWSCIYSVYAINLKENIAFTQSNNAWGQTIEETHNLSHLAKYEK